MSPQQENARTKFPSFIHPIKVLVCGGRRYSNKAFMFEWLDQFSNSNQISHLIHGGAGGADRMAGEWAEDRGIQPVVVPAMWRAHGVAAGPIRNRSMAALKPDLVLAFPGGNGTASMVAIARAERIQVIEIAPLFAEETP